MMSILCGDSSWHNPSGPSANFMMKQPIRGETEEQHGGIEPLASTSEHLKTDWRRYWFPFRKQCHLSVARIPSKSFISWHTGTLARQAVCKHFIDKLMVYISETITCSLTAMQPLFIKHITFIWPCCGFVRQQPQTLWHSGNWSEELLALNLVLGSEKSCWTAVNCCELLHLLHQNKIH